MEVKILNYEKSTLEFEIIGIDSTIPELITDRLSENDSIEIVSYKIDHPLTGNPRMIVKTKSEDALELTIKTIDEIMKDIATLKKEFKQSN